MKRQRIEITIQACEVFGTREETPGAAILRILTAAGFNIRQTPQGPELVQPYEVEERVFGLSRTYIQWIEP